MTPDKFDKTTRSRIMSKIRSKDTVIEKTLRGALRRHGLNDFETYYPAIGKPDIAFVEKKVAIFCDSLFWHGKKNIPETNREYWIAKFKRNIERDKKVTKALQKQGWKVIRFDEDEILGDVDRCVKNIKEVLESR